MQNYLVERIERKIRYKDVTSCNKMLMSVRKVNSFEYKKYKSEVFNFYIKYFIRRIIIGTL